MFSLYVFNIYSFVLSVMDSFVCDKCGKKFTAKTNLTRHEKTHTKENPAQANQIFLINQGF